MKPDPIGPLSRPVSVNRLPPEGSEVAVVASEDERAALAREFELPAIHTLEGRFALSSSGARVHVRGRIHATITQTCVVTLYPFEATVEEEVDVDFTAPDQLPKAVAQEVEAVPMQDEIVNGQIDLGRLTAEFLALGLDPYPRRPGVDFAPEGEGDEKPSPFAALGRLKPS